jgi:glycerol kinase
LKADEIAAIGIANQRETALLWDAASGAPLGRAIVWQCRRTAGRCNELRQAGWEEPVRRITGLRLDPYFSGTKIEWLLKNRPEAKRLLAEGRLRVGTIDSYLIWRLTCGARHVTDFTNASRTMLFDIDKLIWDQSLIELLGIPFDTLPQPVPSSGRVGETDPQWFGAPIPITGVAGDQQASLFGQGCVNPGDMKNTYGTGCFLLMNVGPHPIQSTSGLLTTVAWGLGPGKQNVAYALEGSVFATGAAVQWLRDGLQVIGSSADVGPLAASAGDNGGLYFVPALTGLGAPFWDPDARGLIIGITRATTKAHLARATEEAICCQTRAVMEAMLRDSAVTPSTLKADGGGAADDLLLQLQADLLGLPVSRQNMCESTAFGAAALAGVAVDFWSLDDVARIAATGQTFEPSTPRLDRDRLYREWLRAAERAGGWTQGPSGV